MKILFAFLLIIATFSLYGDVIERYYWENTSEGTERLQGRCLEDEEGNPILGLYYTYQDDTVTETLYSHVRGEVITVDTFTDTSAATYSRSFWGSIGSAIYHWISELICSPPQVAADLIDDIYHLLYPYSDESAFDHSFFLDDLLMLFIGLNNEEDSFGVVGYGEIDDGVRVSYINGVLNRTGHSMESATMISNFHGGVNVHYICNSTNGITWDVLGLIARKLGVTSPQAEQLVITWKNFISEMGGPGEGGTIIHYAHSLGGSDTWKALQFLTPEEKKMIKVVTFGSATMIEKDGLIDAINYVSRCDSVGRLGSLFNSTNVTWVGPEIGIPFLEHLITGETYSAILEELGEDFVINWGGAGRVCQLSSILKKKGGCSKLLAHE